MRRAHGSRLSFFVCFALLACAGPASADTVTLRASGAGDGTIGWDRSTYGSYNTTQFVLGTDRMYWSGYGSAGTDVFFEIPLGAIAGMTPTSATLQLESLGFSTWYYYGSARISHRLGNGTGDLAIDLPHTWGSDTSWTLFDTYGPAGTAGLKQFDVLSVLLADLAAGRTFSTFAITSSRDTSGSVYSSEYDDGTHGPRVVVEGIGLNQGIEPLAVPAPEPATLLLMGTGCLGLVSRMRRAR